MVDPKIQRFSFKARTTFDTKCQCTTTTTTTTWTSTFSPASLSHHTEKQFQFATIRPQSRSFQYQQNLYCIHNYGLANQNVAATYISL